MNSIHTIYIGNDSVIELDGLRNELTGAPINDAAVSFRLLTEAGEEVAGDIWPKTMTYVTGSNGDYRATAVYDMALAANGRYTAEITANAGEGLRAQWDAEVVARRRN